MSRSQRAAQRRTRRAPLALIVVPIVLILGGVGLFLVLTGKADEVIDRLPGGNDPEPVPEFDFKLSKVQVIVTGEDADQQAMRPAAEETAAEVMPVIDELFTNAFLDPNLWKDGDYAAALELFDEAALESAQTQGLETLTLGANAGETYEAVTPSKGSVRFDVLFDREGQAHTVAAHVRFYATGERTDATYIAIVSHGVLFLEDDGGGWQVTAYDMKRNDRETEAPAATGGTSATGGGTATSGATGRPDGPAHARRAPGSVPPDRPRDRARRGVGGRLDPRRHVAGGASTGPGDADPPDRAGARGLHPRAGRVRARVHPGPGERRPAGREITGQRADSIHIVALNPAK